MDQHRIKDMAQPTDDNDAATKKYVDNIPYEGMNEKYFFFFLELFLVLIITIFMLVTLI